MSNTKENKQQQVNELVTRMTREISPDEFREILHDLYQGFNSSEFADDRRSRGGAFYAYSVLNRFFCNIKNL